MSLNHSELIGESYQIGIPGESHSLNLTFLSISTNTHIFGDIEIAFEAELYRDDGQRAVSFSEFNFSHNGHIYTASVARMDAQLDLQDWICFTVSGFFNHNKIEEVDTTKPKPEPIISRFDILDL